MADLSDLARQLQTQVDVLTTYLAREKLSEPSFVPTHEENPLKPSIATLPSDVEVARRKALSLSWNINQLLTPPIQQITSLTWLVYHSYTAQTDVYIVLRQCCFESHHREENRRNDSIGLPRSGHLTPVNCLWHP